MINITVAGHIVGSGRSAYRRIRQYWVIQASAASAHASAQTARIAIISVADDCGHFLGNSRTGPAGCSACIVGLPWRTLLTGSTAETAALLRGFVALTDPSSPFTGGTITLITHRPGSAAVAGALAVRRFGSRTIC